MVIPWKLSSINLFSCPLAQSSISWTQSLAFSGCAFGIHFGTASSSLWFFGRRTSRCPAGVRLSFKRTEVYIWVSRNDYRYRQVAPGAVGLIAATKACLSSFLPILARRFISSRRGRYFTRQWGASGIIGRYQDGNFRISLI